MSGLQRLIDTAWKLAWALLVCAVLFSFLRQLAIDGRPAVAGGQPAHVLDWTGAVLVRLCVTLFVIGLLVRVRRWFAGRAAEAARTRRLDATRTLVGAPARFGVRATGAPAPQRSGHRAFRDRGRKQ
jgi:hypothetical protein